MTTWLHRIVVNACLDRIRRRAARPVLGGLDEQAIDVLAPRQRSAEERADTALGFAAWRGRLDRSTRAY